LFPQGFERPLRFWLELNLVEHRVRAASLSELGLVQTLDELREGRLESAAVITP
jgi:hypothetical protein